MPHSVANHRSFDLARRLFGLTIASLVAASTFTLAAQAATAETPLDQTPAGPFSFELDCGDQYTLLDTAPANASVRVATSSCECGGKRSSVVVSVIADGKLKQLCEVKPSDAACESAVPSGASVVVSVSEKADGDKCRVSGTMKY